MIGQITKRNIKAFHMWIDEFFENNPISNIEFIKATIETRQEIIENIVRNKPINSGERPLRKWKNIPF